MAGGATFCPKLMVDGKRPFDQYPPAREVFTNALRSYLTRAVPPTAFALLLWPLYRAVARRWRRRGLSEAGFFTLVVCAAINTTYCLNHCFYAFIENNRLFEDSKIDRHPHQLGTWKLVVSTMTQGLLGKIVSGPILIYAVLFSMFKRRGMPVFDGPRPSVLKFYVHFMFSSLVNDIGFYWAHRAVHTSWIYGRIHKQHHEWKGTVSYAAEYAHPLESIVANFTPTLGGCLILGSHPLTLCVWLTERLRNTYEAHSGYAFQHPMLNRLGLVNWKGAANHDFHHTGNSGNFGPDWLDWLCGTMDAYAVVGGAHGVVKAKTAEKISYLHPIRA